MLDFALANSRTRHPRWLLKFSLILAVVYVGIAMVWHFIRLEKYDYTYRQDQWVQLGTAVLIQPITDLFLFRKTSYYFDWQKIDPQDIDRSVLPLVLRSTQDKLANYNQTLSSRNLQRDLGYVRQAAVVKPKNYDGKWSLVFCSIDDAVCQQSNLLHSGRVKVLLDGNLEMWGIDQNGKFIQLQLLRYVPVWAELEVLFI